MGHAAGKIIGTIAGQSSVSLVHFCLSITFARLLPEAEFGKYIIGFAICAVLYGAVNAAVMTQVAVCFGAEDNTKKTRAAVSITAVLVGLYGAALIGILAVGASMGWAAQDFALATLCASLAYTLREAATYTLFLTNREYHAFWAQASITISCVVFLALLILGFQITSAVGALYAYAAISVPVLLVTWYVQRPVRNAWRFDAAAVRRIISAVLSSGKWALGSFGVEMLRNQSPNALGLFLGGFSAVAALNAARILVSPPLLGIPLIGRLLLHRFSAWHGQQQSDRVFRVLRTIMLALLLGSLAYCVTVSLMAQQLIDILFEGKYSDSAYLVVFWCAFLLPAIVSEPMKIALFAADKFRVVFLSRATVFVPLCIVGVLLVNLLDPAYIPLLMGFGEAITMLIFAKFTFFRRT